MQQVCKACGTRDEEWTYQNEHGETRELDPPPYIAVGRKCRGCGARQGLNRDLSEAYKISPYEGDGVYTDLIPNPVLEGGVPDDLEGLEP